MKVTLEREIIYGAQKVADFYKDIDMAAPPYMGLVLDDDDYTFVIDHTVTYSIAEGFYFVRMVEYIDTDEDLKNTCELLESLGWQNHAQRTDLLATGSKAGAGHSEAQK